MTGVGGCKGWRSCRCGSGEAALAAAVPPLSGYWQQQLLAELRSADTVHGAGSRDGACKNPRGAGLARGQGSGVRGRREGAETGAAGGSRCPRGLGKLPACFYPNTFTSFCTFFFALTSWGDPGNAGNRRPRATLLPLPSLPSHLPAATSCEPAGDSCLGQPDLGDR